MKPLAEVILETPLHPMIFESMREGRAKFLSFHRTELAGVYLVSVVGTGLVLLTGIDPLWICIYNGLATMGIVLAWRSRAVVRAYDQWLANYDSIYGDVLAALDINGEEMIP